MVRINDVLNWIDRHADVLGLGVTIAIAALGLLLSRRSRRIETLLAWGKARDELREFADAVITAMSEAEGLCEANPEILGQEFWGKYNTAITRLSSLRDQGKLLIPNIYPESIGTRKSSAYEGLRDRALDCVTAAFLATVAINFRAAANNREPALLSEESIEKSTQLKKIRDALVRLPERFSPTCHDGHGWSCKRAIVEAKRQFVSEMQHLTDPRRWQNEMRVIGR